MMLSVVLAFALGALLGKLLLPVLYKLKFGQNIYELAPAFGFFADAFTVEADALTGRGIITMLCFLG
ncbi:MAG: hypothetical protein IJ941_04310 [Clostridia bacterium]|nr:hypothetical protein [Clostridia bacterium]